MSSSRKLILELRLIEGDCIHSLAHLKVSDEVAFMGKNAAISHFNEGVDKSKHRNHRLRLLKFETAELCVMLVELLQDREGWNGMDRQLEAEQKIKAIERG